MDRDRRMTRFISGLCVTLKVFANHCTSRNKQIIKCGFLAICTLLVAGVLPVMAQIPLSGVVKVKAGESSDSCALMDGGKLKCWGDHGRLGLGNREKFSAIDVNTAGVNASDVAMGHNHTCLLTTVGGVKCWGQNDLGQLGNSTNVGQDSQYGLTDVIGLTSNVSAIAAGHEHTCALTTSGAVKCWGNNYSGQIGNGSTNTYLQPSSVSGLSSGIVAIAAGQDHSCALTNYGGVKCWGSNANRKLGDGTSTNRLTPVDVVGLSSGITKIAAGNYHTCALTSSGGVKCWGTNGSGELGFPRVSNYPNSNLQFPPTDVVGLNATVIDIAARGSRTCALTNEGSVKCWGVTSYDSAVPGSSDTPVNIDGLPNDTIAISVGGNHACALSSSGRVMCWGKNNYGQLGDNTNATRLAPVMSLQAFSPIMGLASAENTRAVVRFTPPLHDSGAAVTGYTVISNPAGGIDSHAGTTDSYYGPNEHSHLITGLVNGTQYNFTVVAINALGTGLPSSPSNSITPNTGPNCNNGVIHIGSTYSGTFAQSDCIDNSYWGNGRYIDRYTFSGVAGQQIGFQLFNGGGYNIVSPANRSEGGGRGPNGLSLSYTTLPISGTYVLEISSYDVGGLGAYSFRTTSPNISSPSSVSSSSVSSVMLGSSSIASSLEASSIPASSIAASSSIASSVGISSVAPSSSSIATSIASSSASSVSACSLVTGVAFGTAYSGTLATTDCTGGARGTSYYTDRYSFTGTPGQLIAIQLSGSFDTFVNLKNPSGLVIASNDDGGGGTNSRIPATSGSFTIPAGATGTYVIEVTSYSSLATGSYSLTVTSAVASSSSSVVASSSVSSASSASSCSTAVAAVSGVTNSGTLATTDCTTGARGAGYYTDRFSFTGTSGQLISIQLTSSAFDTFVYLKNSSGTVITSNDDGGGGTNSRIPASSGNFTLPVSGSFVIEVTSYSTQRTGAYSLLFIRQ
jgi:alpha-tubulin suppressor-like RCC1 family protein